MESFRDSIAALRDEAQRAVEADEAVWAAANSMQDTEEAEASGVLIGRLEAYQQVLDLLDAQRAVVQDGARSPHT